MPVLLFGAENRAHKIELEADIDSGRIFAKNKKASKSRKRKNSNKRKLIKKKNNRKYSLIKKEKSVRLRSHRFFCGVN